MTNFQLPHRVHWYQTVWGVGLIGLLVLIGAIAILITILTIKYTLDIRHGQGAEVGQEFYGPFSSLGKNTVITPAVVDRTRLEQGDFPYLGTDHAPITIVEFVDLKCPNCLLAYPIMNQVLQKYGKNIKLVIRQFPLESLHPGTTQVSLFAECARAQGKFLGAYSLAFTQPERLPEVWTDDTTLSLGQTLGMNIEQLQSCLLDPVTTQLVNRDYADALSSGAQGTPTFFVNGKKLEGVVPLDAWAQILN